MPYDETLADRVRRALARRRGFVERKMFGGIGFLLNGNMCCGVWKEYLILRLGPKSADAALQQPYVKEFDITGRAMKGWVMVASAGIETDKELSDWIRRASRFVAALPAK